MSQTDKNNFNEFVILSAEKKKEDENIKHTYFNDWISLAAINYEKQLELIKTIVGNDVSKEVKFAIVSKARKEYYPKDWVILNVNFYL